MELVCTAVGGTGGSSAGAAQAAHLRGTIVMFCIGLRGSVLNYASATVAWLGGGLRSMAIGLVRLPASPLL